MGTLFKTKTFWIGIASLFVGVGLIVAGVPAGINAIAVSAGIMIICLAT